MLLKWSLHFKMVIKEEGLPYSILMEFIAVLRHYMNFLQKQKVGMDIENFWISLLLSMI